MSADAALATQPIAPVRRESSRLRLVTRRLLHSPLALASFAVLALAILIALLAPVLAPYAPEQTDFSHTLSPPGTPGHLLGPTTWVETCCPASCRDAGLAPRGRTFGGDGPGHRRPPRPRRRLLPAADAFISRFTDLLLAFPFLILAVGRAAIRGASLGNAAVAIGIAQIPGVIRIVRSDTLRLKSLDFVAAAWWTGPVTCGSCCGTSCPTPSR